MQPCSTDKLAAAGITDVGRQREHNEDRFVVAHGGRLVAVADGMGGHNAGEVAAALAIEGLLERFQPVEREGASDVSLRLAEAIRHANARVRAAAAAKRALRGMGTTIVAAAFGGGAAAIAHAGDSRAYLLRRGALLRLTRDHSLREAMAALPAARDLTPDELEAVPGNVILRALGSADDIAIETSIVELEDKDRLLLCSDGLSGMISDGALQTLLVACPDQSAALTELIRFANEAGGDDNVTAVLVDVGD